MTIKELINELQKYDSNCRVVLYSHGCSPEEELEIIGCCESKITDQDGNIIEKVIELYEY